MLWNVEVVPALVVSDHPDYLLAGFDYLIGQFLEDLIPDKFFFFEVMPKNHIDGHNIHLF